MRDACPSVHERLAKFLSLQVRALCGYDSAVARHGQYASPKAWQGQTRSANTVDSARRAATIDKKSPASTNVMRHQMTTLRPNAWQLERTRLAKPQQRATTADPQTNLALRETVVLCDHAFNLARRRRNGWTTHTQTPQTKGARVYCGGATDVRATRLPRVDNVRTVCTYGYGRGVQHTPYNTTPANSQAPYPNHACDS